MPRHDAALAEADEHDRIVRADPRLFHRLEHGALVLGLHCRRQHQREVAVEVVDGALVAEP